MAPRSAIGRLPGEGQNIRVEDYLNDQLQTETDLENLDSLLENVQKQHILLEKQVRYHSARIVHEIPDDRSASRRRINTG